MSGVTGDFAKLASLTGMLEDLGKEDLRELSQVLSAEALTQTQLGFVEGRDPYGNPWKPLKYRKGEPLRKTGRLMNSWVARPRPSGFSIGSNVEYGPFHQDGTKTIAQRMMIPHEGDMPPIWSEELEAIAREWLERKGLRP